MYRVVAFNRFNGCRVPRGNVVDHPYTEDQPLCDVSRLIVVRILASSIPEGLENNPTVTLKLDELMASEEFKTREEPYKDEDSVEKTRTVHGYFDELGLSSKPYPEIDMEDVEWQIR